MARETTPAHPSPRARSLAKNDPREKWRSHIARTHARTTCIYVSVVRVSVTVKARGDRCDLGKATVFRLYPLKAENRIFTLCASYDDVRILN